MARGGGIQMSEQPHNPSQGGVQIELRPKAKLKAPRLYKVLLHNDDYTPREFVVLLLQGVFHMGEAEATSVMLFIHNHGLGVVGVYTFEVAETKVSEVMAAAERATFPLLCTMEPEDGHHT